MTRVLYFDASAGVSGDMFVGALLDVGADLDVIREHVQALGVPGMHLTAEKVTRRGIAGTKFRVVDPATGQDVDHDSVQLAGTDDHHDHAHHSGHGAGQKGAGEGHGKQDPHGKCVGARPHMHRGFTEIKRLIEAAELPSQVARDTIAVFRLLGEAEAKVHGSDLEAIHFHEVGALDSIADIVAGCSAMNQLGADVVVCSPIHVGSGTVKCAHGTLPVPAPATMELLGGLPAYSTEVRGELATPTGVALVRHFCSDFRTMPLMRVETSGYGAGTKDFGVPGVFRAILGTQPGGMESIPTDSRWQTAQA